MKTAKKKSPTARTMEALRKTGYLTAVCERWNHFAKIRQDIFGFIDILYLTGSNIVAVQCTTGANHAARRTKILGSEAALEWIKSGGLIEVWSWTQHDRLWTCRKESIVEEDFA